jgi:hypothetical protein
MRIEKMTKMYIDKDQQQEIYNNCKIEDNRHELTFKKWKIENKDVYEFED